MIRNVTSCPRLDSKPLPDAATASTSPRPQQHTPLQPANVDANPAPASKVPVPPKEINIAFQFSSHPQLFVRKGTAADPKAAMLGAGAFGAAFLYVQPPPQHDHVPHPVGSAAADKLVEHELLPELLDRRCRDPHPIDNPPPPQPSQMIPEGRTARARSGSVLRSAASLPQLKSSTGPTVEDHRGATPPSPIHQQPLRSGHSEVVIKVCRTPISGEFDELPRAAHKNHGSVPSRPGWHVRVVRGENRILRYLQKAHILNATYQRGIHLSSTPSQANHIVKLLADLPADGRSGEQIFETTPYCTQMPWPVASSTTARVVNQHPPHDVGSKAAAFFSSDGRPPHRMLVFEPLVDLDSEFVDGRWRKTLRPWTIQQVEDAARDTIAGLQFLHAHAVVHADMKPANLMRDPRTGAVKIIDLGGARRFVCLEDQFTNSITVVEERDAAMNSAETEAALLRQTSTVGLTSMTGSPHFMAPEILLQACRYRDSAGASRCVLRDYTRHPDGLHDPADIGLLRLALDDYATGWGTKADIWSWACCVLSFIVRMSTSVEDREATTLICPFDFVFDDEDSDALYPMHTMSQHEYEQPFYHRWARQYPLRIQRVAVEGVCVDAGVLKGLSPELNRMVHAAFRHHLQRPTAANIAQILGSGDKRNQMSQAAEAPARTMTTTVDSEATLKNSAKASSEMGGGGRSPPPSMLPPRLPNTESTTAGIKLEILIPEPKVEVVMALGSPAPSAVEPQGATRETPSMMPLQPKVMSTVTRHAGSGLGLSVSMTDAAAAAAAHPATSMSGASATGLLSRWLTKVPLSPSSKRSPECGMLTMSKYAYPDQARRFTLPSLRRAAEPKGRSDGEAVEMPFPTIDSWYGTTAKVGPPRTRRRTFRLGLLRKD